MRIALTIWSLEVWRVQESSTGCRKPPQCHPLKTPRRGRTDQLEHHGPKRRRLEWCDGARTQRARWSAWKTYHVTSGLARLTANPSSGPISTASRLRRKKPFQFDYLEEIPPSGSPRSKRTRAPCVDAVVTSDRAGRNGRCADTNQALHSRRDPRTPGRGEQCRHHLARFRSLCPEGYGIRSAPGTYFLSSYVKERCILHGSWKPDEATYIIDVVQFLEVWCLSEQVGMNRTDRSESETVNPIWSNRNDTLFAYYGKHTRSTRGESSSAPSAPTTMLSSSTK